MLPEQSTSLRRTHPERMLDPDPKAGRPQREDPKARTHAFTVQAAAARLHLSHRPVQLFRLACKAPDAPGYQVNLRPSPRRRR